MPGFVLAQLVGLAAGVALLLMLYPVLDPGDGHATDEVVVPHTTTTQVQRHDVHAP